MNEKELRAAVERVILSELAKIGEPYVPVMSSNRHCHLCQADVERLFGAGYRLTKLRDLVQPGQFACNERVTIETEKGKLTLRVVGPARGKTQVELALTDAIKLGLRPPIRMSGELEGSPGCVLSSGNARITLSSGVIVAARHLICLRRRRKPLTFGMATWSAFAWRDRARRHWMASSCEAAQRIDWRRILIRTRRMPAPCGTVSFAA